MRVRALKDDDDAPVCRDEDMLQPIDPPPRARRRAYHALFALLAFGCEGSPERPPPSKPEADIDLTDLVQYDTKTADVRDVYATGACVDGATRACRVYLPSHNDVQPCFVGQQTCAASEWGECESGELVDANSNDAELDPDDLPK